MAGTLVDLLRESAARHPDRLALRARAGEVRSYATLWRAAGELAALLAAHGVGPGTRVALWAEKTPRAVEAIAGTLLAGAAVVPIDARAPWRRAQRIVADAAPRVLIVDGLRAPSVAEVLGPGADQLVLDADAEGWGQSALAGGTSPPAVSPETPAYLLYTSGSTGAPKGVVLSHRAVRAFVDWAVATFQPSADDRFASHAPLHFDLSLFDLWGAFAVGAVVRLFDATEATLTPWLADEVEAAGITVWYSVPSALVAMLERGKLRADGWPSVRLLLFAGEVFPPRQLARLRAALPHPRLANLFGPTETNVCTWFEVPSAVDDGAPLPIGRPCAHLDIVVCDAALREVAPGTVGELCVAGANLLSAYWNDEALTAARLVPDPRTDRQGLVFRTGDRVALGADGNLHFRGRRDHQIKRRGHRIELGDIEAAVLELDDVEAAAAVALAADEGEVRIDAWVGCASATLRPVDVEAHLRERLAGPMTPDHVFVRPALPRTSSGKVDRQALERESMLWSPPR